MSTLSLFGGTGFVLGRYAQLYPEAFVEPRDRCFSTHTDALYGISTVSNYHPKNGDLNTDVDTNLRHLLKVLPNVPGTFNYVSTWFVAANAGQDADAPAREDCACDPRGFYSSTKFCAENLVRSYQESISNRPYRILRLCGVIGNDPRAGPRKNAMEHMLGKLVRGEEVQVYTGDAYRDTLHVEDVCSAIHTIVTKGELNTIYNVGRGSSTRMWDIIQYARERVDSKSKVTLVVPPRFHQQVQVDSFHMDTTKLRGLGWQPSMSIWESVDKVLAGIERTQP